MARKHARTTLRSSGAGRPDDGVTSIEYGLLATAIALLVSAGVIGLGPRVLAIFAGIGG